MPQKTKYRVLAVDDDENSRQLCRRCFEALGVQCDVAADALAAESHLRARNYDAVVSDLRMPKKHGHQFVTELLSAGFRGMVFVATGVTEARLVGDLIHRGVEDVVSKPVDYRFFASKVLAKLERESRNGMKGDADQPDVKEQLEAATTGLKAQLAGITESFESTIQSLEKQRSRLEDGYVGSVRILTDLLSLFSQSEGSHSRRVEDLAIRIATGLGMERADVINLRVAALVHEIGQFGLPDAMRNKSPGTLTPAELSEFRKYPEIGARLLGEVEGGKMVSAIVRHHCENYDGSGYPDGIQGETIPLGARILRVADTVDTYAMHHPDQDSFENIKSLLLPDRARKFDSGVVEAALDVLGESYAGRGKESAIEISGHELRSGMTIAESVYDKHGRCLVRTGARLSETMVARIRGELRGKKVKVLTAPRDT